MSNPLFDLQRLLSGQVSMAGRVVAISSGVARVATPNGIMEVAHDGILGVGDRVTVRDGRAVRVQASDDFPVFFV